ncbi:hypothetical protein BGZ65_006771 [Modicella reniformis]|uniref:Uncharacterized protein n=1 Tax=Modicella reniformis TaxID=1440133 RepID=A0A9P6MG03_9FUNG|nr:hypothetical protein BGZ65_006771 [Modicella reniformis]
MTWELLYKKQPSPFAVEDLSEAYWARKSWPLLMELLEDVENIYMLDGEKTGIDSSRRRNQGRTWNPEEDIPRKRLGRKLDMIARDVMENKDWAIVERMKEWDPQSTKFLKESGFDLIREQLTIMHNRLHEAHDDLFQNQARFFGIYTGDRGFQAFELRPADGQSYVSLFHLYNPQDLPTNMNDLKVHFQGLTKLVQIRICLLNTIELYRASVKPTKDKEQEVEENQEEDMSWLYQSGREDLNVNLFLASSPPYPADDP